MILFLLRFFPPPCLTGTTKISRTYPKAHRMCVIFYPHNHGLGYYNIILYIFQAHTEKNSTFYIFFGFYDLKKRKSRPQTALSIITEFYLLIFDRKLLPTGLKSTPRYSAIVAAMEEYVEPTPRLTGATCLP